jgi:hypothetical protein
MKTVLFAVGLTLCCDILRPLRHGMEAFQDTERPVWLSMHVYEDMCAEICNVRDGIKFLQTQTNNAFTSLHLPNWTAHGLPATTDLKLRGVVLQPIGWRWGDSDDTRQEWDMDKVLIEAFDLAEQLGDALLARKAHIERIGSCTDIVRACFNVADFARCCTGSKTSTGRLRFESNIERNAWGQGALRQFVSAAAEVRKILYTVI